jgi:5S rRNA maturation endonuclease (ribonuclease M5)
VRSSSRDPERVHEKLRELLREISHLSAVVVVEGPRDVEALRLIGFDGRIEICSRVNVSDFDLAESLKAKAPSVVLLTDFDKEGKRLNRHLKRLLELRGVKVEAGLRRRLGTLMAAIGIYVIEALDDALLA